MVSAGFGYPNRSTNWSLMRSEFNGSQANGFKLAKFAYFCNLESLYLDIKWFAYNTYSLKSKVAFVVMKVFSNENTK